jgi:DNA-binding transcriptional MocR family regulator
MSVTASTIKLRNTAFTREKLAWIDSVADDLGVSHLAFRVAHRLGRYMNRTKREAWPSQATLAENVGVTDRAIRKAIAELVSRGHIEVDPGAGKLSTRYRMKGKSNASRGTAVPPSPERDFHPARNEISTQAGTVVPPNTFTEHVEGTHADA